MADTKFNNFLNSIINKIRNSGYKDYVEGEEIKDFIENDRRYLDNQKVFHKRQGATNAILSAAQVAQNMTAKSPETPSSSFIKAPEFSFSRESYIDDLNRQLGGGYSVARDVAMKFGSPRNALASISDVAKAGSEGMSKINENYDSVVNKQRSATVGAENQNEQFRNQNDWKRQQVVAQDNLRRSQAITQGLSNITNSVFGSRQSGLEVDNMKNINRLMQLAINEGISATELARVIYGMGFNQDEDNPVPNNIDYNNK